jgi:hypothetical protein
LVESPLVAVEQREEISWFTGMATGPRHRIYCYYSIKRQFLPGRGEYYVYRGYSCIDHREKGKMGKGAEEERWRR